MTGLRWKRALYAGTAVSFVLATLSLITADDGEEVAAFTMSLAAGLLMSWGVALVARWLQRRAER
ncbi:MAG: hypothetical protein QG671_2085 [Actinomycetota bacterium]|nr:hypothetical protein [Actinomycetota bacterium]